MRSILVACLVLGMGCSQAQRDLEEIEKRACACGKDPECGAFMIDDLVAWADKYKDDSVSNESDLRRSLENTVSCIMQSGADPMRLMSLGR